MDKCLTSLTAFALFCSYKNGMRKMVSLAVLANLRNQSKEPPCVQALQPKDKMV
jgi:hypothetical protein